LKICLIGMTSPFRGGISHYTFSLARELARTHQVYLISFKTLCPQLRFRGRTQRDFSARQFHVQHMPLLSCMDPRTWSRVLNTIQRQRPELVVLQWWSVFHLLPYAFLCIMVRCFLRSKVCYLCHNVLPYERGRLSTIATLIAFLFVDRFIVQCRSDAVTLHRIRPGSVVQITPHPVFDQFRFTPDLTRAEAKRRLGVTGPTLLFFGQIRAHKDLEYLIDALPRVLVHMECTLFIVGEFYATEKICRQRIRHHQLERWVRVVNRYIPNEEVELYFSAADLIVLPYVTASQSGVLQIARSFNLPAVATRVGGLPEQVLHGRTGYLVAPRDSEALANAILAFFREHKAEEFRENIERTRSHYTWRRVADAIVSLP